MNQVAQHFPFPACQLVAVGLAAFSQLADLQRKFGEKAVPNPVAALALRRIGQVADHLCQRFPFVDEGPFDALKERWGERLFEGSHSLIVGTPSPVGGCQQNAMRDERADAALLLAA